MCAVTPCMGVWIEISPSETLKSAIESLPVWECGLKLYREYLINLSWGSLPVWECGLKYVSRETNV